MINQHKLVKHATSLAGRAAVTDSIRVWRVRSHCTWIAWITNACLVVLPMQHQKTKAAVIVIKIQVSCPQQLVLSRLLLKLKPENWKIYDYSLLQVFLCLQLSPPHLVVCSAWEVRSERYTFFSCIKFIAFIFHLLIPGKLSLAVPLKWKFIVVFKGFKSWAGAQKYLV